MVDGKGRLRKGSNRLHDLVVGLFLARESILILVLVFCCLEEKVFCILVSFFGKNVSEQGVFGVDSP